MNATDSISFDELDAYLTSRQRGETCLPPGNARGDQIGLIDSLVQLSGRMHPEPAFIRALALRLQRASEKEDPAPEWVKTMHRNPGRQPRRSPGVTRVAVIALLCSMLLVAVGITSFLVFNRFVQSPATLALEPTEPVAQTPQEVVTALPTEPAPAYTPFPTPSQLPILPAIARAMGLGFGGGGSGQTPAELTYRLGTELPAGPSELTAYFRQTNPPLTLDVTRQIAAQWDLNTRLYWTPGVAELPSDSSTGRFYFAFDGMQQFVIDGATVNYRNLAIFPVYGGHQYPQTGLPSYEQTAASATQFLDSRGQLGFPYTTSFDSYSYGIIAFYRLLDGWRLVTPAAWVQVDPQGQVGAAFSRSLTLEAIGSYPLLSAQEAWQNLTTDSASERIWRSITPSQDGNPKYWGRVHPAGQMAHLFGPLDYLLLPVDRGGNARISLNNLVLEGDLSGLIQSARANQGYFHVWGVVRESEGLRSLQVDGWEPFDEFNGYFNGSVSRQADGDFLRLEDGHTLRLPNLPADVPDGEPLYVNGGLVGDTLEWFILQVHPAGEGQNPAAIPSGEVLIDKVELVYLNPVESLPPEVSQDPAYKMLQPVWCFRGKLGVEHNLTVYVQAVR